MDMTQNDDYILIKGTMENNIKNLSLSIPKRQITVLAAVSGTPMEMMACKDSVTGHYMASELK